MKQLQRVDYKTIKQLHLPNKSLKPQVLTWAAKNKTFVVIDDRSRQPWIAYRPNKNSRDMIGGTTIENKQQSSLKTEANIKKWLL